MWITPILLVRADGVGDLCQSTCSTRRPPLEIALGLIVGALAGIPFGILRGMHTDVRPTDRRGVMYLGSSWVTLAIFAGAFGLRYGVRMLMPQRGSLVRYDRRCAARLRDRVYRDELRRDL